MNKGFIAFGIILLLAAFILLSGMSSNEYNEYIKVNKTIIDKNKIQQISISGDKLSFKPVDIKDTEQIYAITDYLNSIDIIGNGNDNNRSAYKLKIKFRDNIMREVVLADREFFTIIADICECNQTKAGEPSFSGSVISEKMSLSDIHTCVIRDKYNKEHSVVLNYAEIIQVNGEGRKVLHLKDSVVVFYKNKILTDPSVDKSIEATTIYIH